LASGIRFTPPYQPDVSASDATSDIDKLYRVLIGPAETSSGSRSISAK
jgi:hypothetical protein